jgi:hypothetical protein
MMREAIFRLRKDNIKFYTDLIIELGLLRKRNECAICFRKIDFKDYNIQLCRKCRQTLLLREKESII